MLYILLALDEGAMLEAAFSGRKPPIAKVIKISFDRVVVEKVEKDHREKVQQSREDFVRRFTPKVSFNLVEKEIIRAWNDSEFIRRLERTRGDETRNFPMKPVDYDAEFINWLRRCIKEIGRSKVLDEMDQYFRVCVSGEHVWDKVNHGFKNLRGFLNKLLILRKNKSRGWWNTFQAPAQIKDSTPKVTHAIADIFAQRFNKRKAFPLTNPSRDYKIFLKFKSKLDSMGTIHGKPEKYLKAANMIFDALESHFTEDIISPGNLISPYTWGIILPKYLKERG